MKKNNLLATLGLVSVITLAACGSDATNASEKNNDTKQETTEKETDSTRDDSEAEDSEEDANEGDWEYQVGDMNEDGNFKLLARNDTSDTIETASISLHFPQVTVAEVVEWPEELADSYDFEPTGVIQIDMEVSNSSEDTINFYMDQATITTNTGEQLEPDLLTSDHIGGVFIGAVNKSGSVRYMLESSDPNEIEWVRVLINAPHDANFESLGHDIDVQIDF
ncbi:MULTISPECIES: hypothetical protein [Shouchella]|uniref:hypothetical protein n=1 Tax=Shouchella TaxID=2893057 RepID=UPI000BA6F017|nr:MULTISPECIES: hypothetical protein [Shouchella]MCM3380284.1 hypothetical protein [Shouchella rhizosphaerae]MDO7268095.1 hypothetical protein [Shouchella clausii]MDO7287975.1 hypothetical protein [Shouchella clausii]PAD19588.1 hypothetical protein CHH73_00490 [Shouchella clausii]PAE85000.1 hypothetical protein CHH77_02475 [Shouchella clausii]